MKRFFAQLYIWILLVLLYAPLVFIAIFSFTESRVLGNWTGFSGKLYANLFGMRISKAQQLSNWQADVLSDKQKVYAATDAWACIVIYEELMRLNESKDYDLCETNEPQQDE